MQEFMFHLPTKIYFGSQAIERIGEETKKLGRKALVVSTIRNFARETGILKKIEKRGVKVVLFEEVESNPSIETVEKGADLSKRERCDVIIGVGGGSSIDTAKGIAVLSTNPGPLTHYLGRDKVKNPPLPIIAIPTTAGTGSEVGLYAAFVNNEKVPPRKETIGDRLIFPKVALFDPQLTLSLPLPATADSGVDALSQAIESYISKRSSNLTEMLALKAVELLAQYLPKVMKNPKNLEFRSFCLYASLLQGIAIAQTGTVLVHAMSFGLTPEFGISHGKAVGILLPWVCKFNLRSNYPKFSSLARALGEKTEGLSEKERAKRFVERIRELLLQVGMPQNLKEKKIKEEKIEELAKEVMKDRPRILANPRLPTLSDVVGIYKKSLWGIR
ncbi:alcohol dehydrogenase [Candidatus Aerophobetes bacterium]|uniref:Alcohol dehydrogenase n=1 Tax=Aerophobetes bacterium TaxID=2030807 RepID=A0A662DIU6_UNCAE|nr:MAG: alcohol dehydrogenase [Candidatus Aerophobetes bacterium]